MDLQGNKQLSKIDRCHIGYSENVQCDIYQVHTNNVDLYLPGGKLWPGRTFVVAVGPK